MHQNDLGWSEDVHKKLSLCGIELCKTSFPLLMINAPYRNPRLKCQICNQVVGDANINISPYNTYQIMCIIITHWWELQSYILVDCEYM